MLSARVHTPEFHRAAEATSHTDIWNIEAGVDKNQRVTGISVVVKDRGPARTVAVAADPYPSVGALRRIGVAELQGRADSHVNGIDRCRHHIPLYFAAG